jgi:hypothetical protein
MRDRVVLFHPFHRYPGSLAQIGRCPFHRCRVASAQASTPDPESLPATSAESVRVGPDPGRLAGALAAAHSPAPVCLSVVSEATAEKKIGSLIRICGGRF